MADKPKCISCAHAYRGECLATHTDYTDSGPIRRRIVFAPSCKEPDKLGHVYRHYCNGKQFAARPDALTLQYDEEAWLDSLASIPYP